jgi:hypothetical protein
MNIDLTLAPPLVEEDYFKTFISCSVVSIVANSSFKVARVILCIVSAS